MTRTLKYQVIKDWLVEQAADPAARKAMPSIRQIRKRFGVSLAPVNRALQELEQEGIIERRQGTATVASNRSRAINKPTQTGRKVGTVVAIFPDYPTEVYWRMCHVLEHQARLLDLELQMYKFDHTLDLADALAFAKSQKTLCGIVLVTGSSALDITQLDQLALADIPVTLCDHLFEYDVVPGNVTILTPHASITGTQAVEYLHSMGHRQIGYVRNEPKTDQGDQKLSAVLRAARDLEMPIDKRAVFSAAIKSWSSSMDAAVELTKSAIPIIHELGITALIYQSTPGAFAACQVFYETHMKVGKDICVISGGDYEYARYACPALTVLATDYMQMAKDAVNFLIDKPADLPTTVQYKPQVIERQSVCRLD